jgi:class 3 adenylate cyclase
MENQSDQQKDATILTTELTGFDRLAEESGNERAIELYNDFFQKAEELISGASGKVNRYSGFCQVAVFQGEKVLKKLALKALEAALEIRDHFNEFVSEHKLKQISGIKMGLNAGPVVLATIGAGDKKNLTVLGETVDSAMRIKDLAAEGKILAGYHCFEAGKDKFSFVALEPIPQPGKKEALRLYELITAKRTSVHTESARQVVSEMVGRSTEYDLIQKRIRNLMDGKGSIVTISGKAGIGKSRLMAELKSTELIKKAALHEGRAFSTGQNLSYYPLIQILKSWAGIREEDNAAEAARKLEHQIRRMFPEQADEIFPFIATLMGYKLIGKAKQRVEGIEGEPLEKLILKNLRDMLALASEIRPIVIVVEDMHWIDGSSIAYLESLFKLARNHRIMFIVLMRPGYGETGEHMLKFLEENLCDLSLNIFIEPLTESESTDLIVNLLNKTGLPENIRQLIIDKAEGNPFFIEEVIRNFIDEGIIEVKDNHFVVTDKIQTADVPATINEVILSRIEKLDEKTKNLLKTASAIGRNFYYKVLQEATDTISELDDKLEYLKDVQLINERKEKDEIEFLFKHALAQQATYESILLQSRKELHLKIARSIEKVFAEKINEFYGTLVYHYEKAGNKEKTEEYLLKAGDEAFKSGASNEAVNFYQEALKMRHSKPVDKAEEDKIKELQINIGFAQQAAGHNIEAIETFEMIMQRYFGRKFPKDEKSEKINGLFGMIRFILKVYLHPYKKHKIPTPDYNLYLKIITNWGQAISTLNPKRFLLLSFIFVKDIFNYEISESPPALSLTTQCSSFFMWSGISLKISKKLINTAQKAGIDNHPEIRIDYRYIRVMHNFHAGHWEIDEDFEQIYQDALWIGRYWPTTIYTLFSGFMYVELGRCGKMIEVATRLNEISEAFDNSHAKAQALRFLSMGHYRFRKNQEALNIAEEGITYTAKTGHHAMLLVIWCAKSLAHSAINQHKEARQALDEAEKYIGDRKVISIYHCAYLLAKAQIELSELKDCIQRNQPHDKQSGALLKTINKLIKLSKNLRSAATEAYRLKATTYWLLNKNATAYRFFDESVRVGEQLNHRLELSRTYFELGKFLSDPNTKPTQLNKLTGKDYLEKARTMFVEMYLQWDLEEYRKFVSRQATP